MSDSGTDSGTVPSQGDVGRASVAILILILILAAALSIPILTHPLPPLTDYPNNLARTHVIATIGSDADFQRFYTIEWGIIPNLMMDLVVPVLNRVVGIYAAGQIFALVAIMLIFSGTFALNRVLFGRWTVVPAVAALIIYNEVLLVGVMNYVFGIGLALWALTVWIALRDRPWPWRFAASTLFVVALFFCHLFALGLYALGLLAFELRRLWAARRESLRMRLIDFVASGAPFLAAAGLLLLSPTVGLAGDIEFELWGKFEGLLLVFTVYYYSIAALLIAALTLAAVFLMWRGLIHLHPVGWVLLAVGAIVYMALPRTLFATHLADQRLPAAMAFMLVACLDVDLHERNVRRALAILIVGLMAVRFAEIQIAWDTLSQQTSAFLRSVHVIHRGARVLVVHRDRNAYSATTGVVSDFNLPHAASLATIERSALVSTNFVVTGKHVLQVREPFLGLVNREDRIPPPVEELQRAISSVDSSDQAYWSHWPRDFDYVYVLFTLPGAANPDAAWLALCAEGPGFQLYRVIHKI